MLLKVRKIFQLTPQHSIPILTLSEVMKEKGNMFGKTKKAAIE
jgi:hypothetical protein